MHDKFIYLYAYFRSVATISLYSSDDLRKERENGGNMGFHYLDQNMHRK